MSKETFTCKRDLVYRQKRPAVPKIVLFRNGNGLRSRVGTLFHLPRVRVVLVTEDAQYLRCALVSKET